MNLNKNEIWHKDLLLHMAEEVTGESLQYEPGKKRIVTINGEPTKLLLHIHGEQDLDYTSTDQEVHQTLNFVFEKGRKVVSANLVRNSKEVTI